MLIDGSPKGYFKYCRGEAGWFSSPSFLLSKTSWVDTSPTWWIRALFYWCVILHIFYMSMMCRSFIELLIRTRGWFWMPLSFVISFQVNMWTERNLLSTLAGVFQRPELLIFFSLWVWRVVVNLWLIWGFLASLGHLRVVGWFLGLTRLRAS